jgi:hypothetical protein
MNEYRRFKLWQIASRHGRDRLVHRFNPGPLTRKMLVKRR